MKNNPPFKVVEITSHKLVIGGKEILGPTPGSYPFLQADYKGLHIVMFWSTSNSFTNSNVHAFNDKGELVWIVSPIVPDNRADSPYSSFTWSPRRNQICLIGYSGAIAALDDTNGSVELLKQSDPL
ncbi:MAG: hypothetical protein KF799_15605 [Bdellovibrionales bacterium]|nr:hypothetical protein [Bdellovibrionales bacterium]